MVNYQNGKIYKIESHNGDKIYIGSTAKKYLSQRLVAHRDDYTSWKKVDSTRFNFTSFKLFEVYGIDNCFITLLESYPCNSKDELAAREAHYIKSMSCVNKYVPLRTKQDYREDNRQELRDKALEYYNNNKERLYIKITCECGLEFAYRYKSRHLKTLTHQQFINQKPN